MTMPKLIGLFCLGAIVAVLILGLFAYGLNIGDLSLHDQNFGSRIALDPVCAEGGIIGRTAMELPHGECIILRYPMSRAKPNVEAEAVLGDTRRPDDDLQILSIHPESHWNVSRNRPDQMTTFNCATFAIGEKIGLTRFDWLETRPRRLTNDKCPAQTVLDSFFSLTAVYPVDRIDWEWLDTSHELDPGDIVAFVMTGENTRFAHLGHISKVREKNMLVSKLGKGPIVSGTIRATSLRYEGVFNEVRIYRQQSSLAN